MSQVMIRRDLLAQADRLGQVLDASRARLTTAAVSVPGTLDVVFRADLRRLSDYQTLMERDLDRIRRQLQRRESLGAALVLGVLGVGALLSALGLKVWQHREETKTLETQMRWYEDLISKHGYTQDQAHQIVYGGAGGISGALDKMIIISAIIAGTFVFLKMKK